MSQTQKIDVRDADGEKTGSFELPGALFDVDANVALIHQVVVAQQAAARQGTHATKTRGDVRGGGIKPWRQKGTGRARQGSRRAPQWVGGGTVHGPHPHGYGQRTPKKMIAAALRGALSDRARDERLFVLTSLVSSEAPSTKQAEATLRSLGDFARWLVVLDRDDATNWLSVRNLPEVHVLSWDQLNAYDVLVGDAVVFTEVAMQQFVASRNVHTAEPADESGVKVDEGAEEVGAATQKDAK